MPADTGAGGGGGFVTSLFTLLVGAALAFGAQILHRRASQRADAFRDRLDELCEDIQQFSNVAGEYWSLDGTAPQLRKLEAQTFALNHRINALASLLGEQDDRFREATEDILINLSIAGTGGDFQVRGRAAEPQRYIQIEQRAVALSHEIRRFQRELLSGWFS